MIVYHGTTKTSWEKIKKAKYIDSNLCRYQNRKGNYVVNDQHLASTYSIMINGYLHDGIVVIEINVPDDTKLEVINNDIRCAPAAIVYVIREPIPISWCRVVSQED